MQYCKVNGVEYPAIGFYGKISDPDWDYRATVVIHLQMTYAQALETFPEGCRWSIINVDDETGDREEIDHSIYSLSGDITDHRDGTVKIKMGKVSDLEEAYQLLYGGV